MALSAEKQKILDERIEILKRLGGKVPSSELIRLTGWNLGALSTWACRLKISIRCEEGERQRIQKKLDTIAKKRIERNDFGATQINADAIWKIPNIPSAHKMGNFT